MSLQLRISREVSRAPLVRVSITIDIWRKVLNEFYIVLKVSLTIVDFSYIPLTIIDSPMRWSPYIEIIQHPLNYLSIEHQPLLNIKPSMNTFLAVDPSSKGAKWNLLEMSAYICLEITLSSAIVLLRFSKLHNLLEYLFIHSFSTACPNIGVASLGDPGLLVHFLNL